MSAYEPVLRGPTIISGELRVQSTPARLPHAILGYLSSGSWTCRHRRLSWPFTSDGETYRVCLRCGMQRAFDLDTWKMKGRFYNDSRRTVLRSLYPTGPRRAVKESEAKGEVDLFASQRSRRARAIPTKSRYGVIHSVPVLHCETRILMQR